MGTRGPIPKRDEERVRRNIPEDPTVTVQMPGKVEIPELGDISHLGETHPIVVEMYDAMKESASVKFFEPTDWQFARLTLYTLNQELIAAQHNGKPVGAMKLSAINQISAGTKVGSPRLRTNSNFRKPGISLSVRQWR